MALLQRVAHNHSGDLAVLGRPLNETLTDLFSARIVRNLDRLSAKRASATSCPGVTRLAVHDASESTART